MKRSAAPYLSYLARFWRTGEGEPVSWRASLHDIPANRTWRFSGPEALVGFLLDQLAAAGGHEEDSAREPAPDIIPPVGDDDA